MVNKPKVSVEIECVSCQITDPVEEPLKMLARIFIAWLESSIPFASVATPWYPIPCGTCANSEKDSKVIVIVSIFFIIN